MGCLCSHPVANALHSSDTHSPMLNLLQVELMSWIILIANISNITALTKQFDVDSKGANVMGGLADIARSAVTKTGFYTSYPPFSNQQASTVVGRQTADGCAQTGIIRINCVDCLDRTNTAQFALGKCALSFQVNLLSINSVTSLLVNQTCPLSSVA